MYATVILNTRQAGIGNGLTYEGSGLMLGSLVMVPLRKKLIEGIIVNMSQEKPEGDFDVKAISEVLSDDPLLTQRQIDTAGWMASYYMCPLRQALGVWLPGGEWKKLLPEKVMKIRKVVNDGKVMKLGKNQHTVLQFLETRDWVSWDEVKMATGCEKDVLKRLIEREVVEKKWFRTEEHRQMSSANAIISNVSLTPRQTAAYKMIKSDRRPTLLFGITGSGKTEMYAALIRDAIQEGKSAILLLPEILLTENFIERFQQLIDREAIAVVHSRLTPAQRRNQWKRCRAGEVKLVIGSRSALFSPLENPGLIILDEEHEWTYKNEQSPRYHAGKVAEWMCTKQSRGGMQLLLGSATPSVESWYKAKNGDYQLVELPERYGGAKLPTVQVIDLAQIDFGKWYPLSPTLVNAIRMRLERNEQSVLFLNRRGFATSLMCLDCRYRFEDTENNLPYTVHRQGARPYLLSHHTGEELPIPEKCVQCSSVKLYEVGAGTQRIETLLEELFPSARILRADADTLKTPEKMRVLLQTMKEGRADILLGTQSVVKGLDLPNVTLAAVLLADVGLSLPHFRAGERVFQLLTQLTGRSGRAQPGEVIIQTFRPQASEVVLAASHDVRTYLEQEMAERQKAHYPPDTNMLRFVFSGSNARRESADFLGRLPKAGGERLSLSRSPSLFGGGKVWYVFVRGKNVQNLLRNLPQFDGVIDRDPIECL